MSWCCESANGETIVFACAGAAYCGQLTNWAALGLTNEGLAQVLCLSAVVREDSNLKTKERPLWGVQR